MDEAGAGVCDHHIIEWEGKNFSFMVVWSQGEIYSCARDGLRDVFNLFTNYRAMAPSIFHILPP